MGLEEVFEEVVCAARLQPSVDLFNLLHNKPELKLNFCLDLRSKWELRPLRNIIHSIINIPCSFIKYTKKNITLESFTSLLQ